MAKGKIKSLFANKGFGFIKPEEAGKGVWFHASVVKGNIEFDQLQEEMQVEYESQMSDRGLKAVYVRILDEASSISLPSYRFLNPYNFAQFLSKPPNGKTTSSIAQTTLGEKLLAAGIASSSEDIPPQDLDLMGKCPPPPHDRYVGLSGVITCKLETKTPLFISDSEYVQKRPNGHTSYEFFKFKGKPAVPGTSLRGMIRSVFEAVTNSCLPTISDARLSYHLPPAKALKLVPACVEQDDKSKKWHLRLLPGTKPVNADKNDNSPQHAAWVPLYLGKALRPSRNITGASQYAKRANISLNGLTHKSHCLALLKRITHSSGRFSFWNVEKLVPIGRRADLGGPKADERIEEGFLCITGQNIENKHDERFFFAAGGLTSAKSIELNDDKVRHDYQILIQDYQNRHAESIRQLIKKEVAPELPYDDKAAYSRFIVNKNESELTNGDLVYAMISKNGQVEFIVPVSIPRVAYDDSISDLLPDNALRPCDEYNCLCPACRVFGWVYRTKRGEKIEQVAYAGRAQFAHAILKESNGTLPELPLAILSSPKPTTTLFYLKPRDGAIPVKWTSESAAKGYALEFNTLRGRKFYRHHKQANEKIYQRTDSRCDDQNRTIRDALAPGAVFEFTIKFENLAPVELGALLWSLEMDHQSFHRLGFAKPLGFGSVKITVSELKVLNPIKRYTALDTPSLIDAKDWKNKLVEKFQKAAAKKFGQSSFDDLPNIKDLRTLLSERPDELPIHYPRTSQVPDAEGKNFEWFMGNNRKGFYTLPAATEDNGLPLIARDGRVAE